MLSLLAYCPGCSPLCFVFLLGVLLFLVDMFGFSPSELRAVPRVFIDLLCLLKYFAWRAWNDFRFCDVRPGALPIIENTKARAEFHLVLFIKRFKSSRR